VKRQTPYNANFTIGRDGSLVMELFVMEIDGSSKDRWMDE